MHRRLSWQDAIPRIAADFLMIHFSMIGAFAISVLYQEATGSTNQANQLIGGFEHYYTRFFWLLSPIFPATFALLGFYTHTRSYSGKRKNWAIARGVGLGALLFLGANSLLLDSIVGRSVAFSFVALASAALCVSRMAKNYLDNRFEARSLNASDVRQPRVSVLVVGGAGYIGSLLAERLLQLGYKVRVLDALLYGREPLRTVQGNSSFELMVGDCRNIQDVVKAVKDMDAIVDLAAIVGDPACEQDQEAAREINFGATRMLIEVAKGHGVGRFLFASSCSVYGASDHEADEQSEVHPISLYATTKVDSELALLAAQSENFHPTILRFATVFGLGYRPRFDLVVNLLTGRAYQDGKITIFNGQQWRPFIHARDVVEAIIAAMEAPVRLVSGEIFNVGDSDLNHTLQNVAEIIQKTFPNTLVEHVSNADRRNYRVNFDKIRNCLGFRARYTVQYGVEELKTAFVEHIVRDYKDLRYHNQRFLEVAGVVKNKDEVDGLVMAAFDGRTLPSPVARTSHAA
jgi:nucleoside-diphosphate-sugar epimerase